MPKQSCGTCRHYQTEGFYVMQGSCNWLNAYPGMRPEIPIWAARLHPFPVWPGEGRQCPQWQEALP